MATRDPHLAATRIICDAGGMLVGRTRLQKVAYLMQLAGFGDEFDFEYHHFGPFSEDLAFGIDIATAFGAVNEDEKQASWGGRYSVFSLKEPVAPLDPQRAAFAQKAKLVNAVELELAATAAFLFVAEGKKDPWAETRRRKPEKAKDGRLERAMAAYEDLRSLSTPRPLPKLPAA
ncbi:hypothetical protein [Inquilinus limosus]|uniref:hypothetical protein n=1 Tax=Inquilinus limosus TaxID=171674 RepID=UPI00047D1A28|nr:hypothetical protein [Inquilinus limosus]